MSYKMTNEHREKLREQKLGSKHYYNPITGDRIRLRDDEEIPEGFIPGLGNQTQEHKENLSKVLTGKIWIHNPITRETKKINRDQELPDNWSWGRGSYCNGKYRKTKEN